MNRKILLILPIFIFILWVVYRSSRSPSSLKDESQRWASVAYGQNDNTDFRDKCATDSAYAPGCCVDGFEYDIMKNMCNQRDPTWNNGCVDIPDGGKTMPDNKCGVGWRSSCSDIGYSVCSNFNAPDDGGAINLPDSVPKHCSCRKGFDGVYAWYPYDNKHGETYSNASEYRKCSSAPDRCTDYRVGYDHGFTCTHSDECIDNDGTMGTAQFKSLEECQNTC
jgi:hypothetical protein